MQRLVTLKRVCRVGVAATILAILSIVGSALAATRAATDDETSVEFRLEGHMLTATVVPRELELRPGIREELWGHLVRASCATRRLTVTHRTRRWPPGRLSLKYWLGRDVSARVSWCLLEEGGSKGGADIAAADFRRRK